MLPAKRTVTRSLAAGAALTALTCLVPWDHCMCGHLRGLPLPIIHTHHDSVFDVPLPVASMASWYFDAAFALLDVALWGACALLAITVARRIANRRPSPPLRP